MKAWNDGHDRLRKWKEFNPEGAPKQGRRLA
jgi:hypothetical protein